MYLDLLKSCELCGFFPPEEWLDYNGLLCGCAFAIMISDGEVRYVYEFGQYRVDPVTRSLLAEGSPLPLTSKAFETLLALLSAPGTVLTKDEIIDVVWGEIAVEENNLSQQISALRRTLGKDVIITVPGRGYSFVAPVRQVELDPRSDLVIVERTRSSITIDLVNEGRRGWREGRLGMLLACAYVLMVFAITLFTNVGGAHPQTVAVLSFRSFDDRSEAVGQGIRDTLRARLGSLDDVAVRPFSPDVTGTDAITAGRNLHADVVLTGSVQRGDDRIRVAVELVDVASARIVWGDIFDDRRSDMFDLQDAIASRVAQALSARRVSAASL